MSDQAIQLMQGDCLTLLPTISDELVDAVIADPPYGINYQSARRIDKAARMPKIANDTRPFIWWLYDAYRITKMGGAILCFCEWRYQDVFKMAIETAGFTLKSQIIWDRGCHGLGDLNASFAPQHDVVWFGVKGNFCFQNGRPQSIIRSPRVAPNNLVHPNEKPVPLMRHLVEMVTPTGGMVLDPFMGSGSTGAACINTGRRFIGIEKNADYFSIACQRVKNEQRQEGLFTV